jgi:hypothetical protein
MMISKMLPAAVLGFAVIGAHAQGVSAPPAASDPGFPDDKVTPHTPASSFEDLDRNKDKFLSESELGSNPARSFKSLDSNRDERISEQEYATGKSAAAPPDMKNKSTY